MGEVLREYDFHGNKYKANKHGIIFSLKGKPLSLKENKDGYLEVQLRGKTMNKNGNKTRYKVKVHSIIANLFIEKPISNIPLEVNHKDFNRKNNDYTNLEWMTHYENVKYSMSFGNIKPVKSIGEENFKSKLKESDVFKIRNLFKEGLSIRTIYLNYYKSIVSENSIGNICKRRTWNHI